MKIAILKALFDRDFLSEYTAKVFEKKLQIVIYVITA